MWYRISQRRHPRGKSQGRAHPSYASTLDWGEPRVSAVLSISQASLDEGGRTVGPNVLGSSPFRECGATTRLENEVAVDSSQAFELGTEIEMSASSLELQSMISLRQGVEAPGTEGRALGGLVRTDFRGVGEGNPPQQDPANTYRRSSRLERQ